MTLYRYIITGLQRYLVDTYRKHYLKTDVSPIFPEVEHIDKLFIPIVLSRTFKGRLKITKQEIRKLQELFQSDGHGGQIMFIAADAGMGKTTLCRKIISTWCKAYDQEFCQTLEGNTEAQKFMAEEESWRKTEQENVRFMKRFKYLFFVHLRDAHSDSTIESMVENNLLENSHPGIFRHIIKHESDRCLFMLDGVDEWKLDSIHDAKSHGRSRDLPFHDNNCTILYTSRPWKLAERLTQDNESTIELEGLTATSSEWLVYKMIAKLKEGENKPLEDVDFLSELKTKNLGHFQTIPIMVKLLVCIWFDNQELSDKVTAIYCDVLKLIMKVFTNKMKGGHTSRRNAQKRLRLPSLLASSDCANYADVIVALCKFSYQRNSDTDSLVFTDEQLRNQGMTEEQIQVCLDSGLLSKTAITIAASYQHLQISYIHKTFQEFFVALHIATTTGNLAALLETSTTRNAVAEHSVILSFVCGLDNDGVKQIAEHIYSCSTITRDEENDRELQALVFSLIRETQHVEKNSIPLRDIHFDTSNVDDEQLVAEYIDPKRTTLHCKDIAFPKDSMYMQMKRSFNEEFCPFLLALQCLDLECSTNTTFSHSQVTNVLCLPRLLHIAVSGVRCIPDTDCGCKTTDIARADCISNTKKMGEMNARSCRILKSSQILNHILAAPNMETLILQDNEVDQENLAYITGRFEKVRYVTLCNAELSLNRLQLSEKYMNTRLVLLAEVTINGIALKSLIESIPPENPRLWLILCRVLLTHNNLLRNTWDVTTDRSGFVRFQQTFINKNNGVGEVDVKTLAGQIYDCPVPVRDSTNDQSVHQPIFSYIRESQHPLDLSSVPLNEVHISREDDVRMVKYIDPSTVKTLVFTKVTLSATETCLQMNQLEQLKQLKVTNCGFTDQFTPTVVCKMAQYCAGTLIQLTIIHEERDIHISHSQATSLLCLPVLTDITMSGVKCEPDSNNCCGCKLQRQRHGDDSKLKYSRTIGVKHCRLQNTSQVLHHVFDAPQLETLRLVNSKESPNSLRTIIQTSTHIQNVHIEQSSIAHVNLQLSPVIQSLRVVMLMGVPISAATLKSLIQSVPYHHAEVLIRLKKCISQQTSTNTDVKWLQTNWDVHDVCTNDIIVN